MNDNELARALTGIAKMIMDDEGEPVEECEGCGRRRRMLRNRRARVLEARGNEPKEYHYRPDWYKEVWEEGGLFNEMINDIDDIVYDTFYCNGNLDHYWVDRPSHQHVVRSYDVRFEAKMKKLQIPMSDIAEYLDDYGKESRYPPGKLLLDTKSKAFRDFAKYVANGTTHLVFFNWIDDDDDNEEVKEWANEYVKIKWRIAGGKLVAKEWDFANSSTEKELIRTAEWYIEARIADVLAGPNYDNSGPGVARYGPI